MNRPSFRTVLAVASAFGAMAVCAQEALPPPAPKPHDAPAAKDGRPPIARQFIEHLRHTDPQNFQRLMRLRKEDQAAFGKELQTLVRAWQQREHKRHAPMTPEERLCLALSQRYHQAVNDEEREDLGKELAEAVEKSFAARVKAMEGRVQRMEKEIATFNERLDRLKENREKICDERLQELLRPPELDWNADW